jgi:MFS family permease
LLIAPQVLGAVLAPWVGFHSEKKGRRPLLLIGFSLEPLRALLLVLTAAYPALVVAQGLSGVTGAIIGVLTVIVVADLTANTGRFNLSIGVIGALSGVAASMSTSASGFVFQALGPRLGYLPLAAVAAAATAMLWWFLSETKPNTYED